jgi:hypothetical protein
MARLFSVCLGLLCAAAIAAPVPRGAGTGVPYFPTAVGAKWVYERVDGTEEVVTVTAVERDGDTLVVSRQSADGGQYTKMIVSASGLRQGKDRAGGEWGWLLKLGHDPSESWEVPAGGRRTVYAPEEVEVPAGRFKALRVVWQRDGGTLTSWYAPGVGEVKRVERTGGEPERVTRSLKTFDPKGGKK